MRLMLFPARLSHFKEHRLCFGPEAPKDAEQPQPTTEAPKGPDQRAKDKQDNKAVDAAAQSKDGKTLDAAKEADYKKIDDAVKTLREQIAKGEKPDTGPVTQLMQERFNKVFEKTPIATRSLITEMNARYPDLMISGQNNTVKVEPRTPEDIAKREAAAKAKEAGASPAAEEGVSEKDDGKQTELGAAREKFDKATSETEKWEAFAEIIAALIKMFKDAMNGLSGEDDKKPESAADGKPEAGKEQAKATPESAIRGEIVQKMSEKGDKATTQMLRESATDVKIEKQTKLKANQDATIALDVQINRNQTTLQQKTDARTAMNTQLIDAKQRGAPADEVNTLTTQLQKLEQDVKTEEEAMKKLTEQRDQLKKDGETLTKQVDLAKRVEQNLIRITGEMDKTVSKMPGAELTAKVNNGSFEYTIRAKDGKQVNFDSDGHEIKPPEAPKTAAEQIDTKQLEAVRGRLEADTQRIQECVKKGDSAGVDAVVTELNQYRQQSSAANPDIDGYIKIGMASPVVDQDFVNITEKKSYVLRFNDGKFSMNVRTITI